MSMNLGLRQAWFELPALQFTHCVSLGKPLPLSDPHLENGNNML